MKSIIELLSQLNTMQTEHIKVLNERIEVLQQTIEIDKQTIKIQSETINNYLNSKSNE